MSHSCVLPVAAQKIPRDGDCLLSMPQPVGTGWDGGWKMRTAKHRDIILLFFSYMKLAVAAP